MENRLCNICRNIGVARLDLSFIKCKKNIILRYGLLQGKFNGDIRPCVASFSTSQNRRCTPYFTTKNAPGCRSNSANQTATVFTASWQKQRIETKPVYKEIEKRVDFAETDPQKRATELDFCRADAAFEQKTTNELFRAFIVLKLSSYRLIVDNSLKLMSLGQFILRRKLFDALMHATFFGQFAVSAAKADADLRETVERFEAAGIHPMILMTEEEDVGQDPGWFNEAVYDNNRDTMIKCIDLQASLCQGASYPMMSQLKLTSYVKADLLAKLSDLLEQKGLSFSNTTPISYQNCAEGMDGTMEVIPELTHEEMAHLHTVMRRLNTIIQHSAFRGVKILVDAERTNINPAITMITLALMAKFNRRQPQVWNTYQCYLKSAHDNVLQGISIAEQGGFGFGAKVVRGAYMDQERNYAKEQNREDPINPSWEVTNEMYDKVISHLLHYLSEHGSDRCNFIIATHNEESILIATQRMKELGIPVTSTAAVFGQIYGMCDHVSYTLGKAGYHMYKSIPFGDVNEVLPYLSRRAQENKTVFHRLTKEKGLIREELGNRLMPGRRRKMQAD